jgi:hypothetical protein
MARILHGRERRGRWRVEGERQFKEANAMNQDKGIVGIVVGGLVALAAAFFILGGGDYGGKKTVEGDRDLPPIASAGRN